MASTIFLDPHFLSVKLDIGGFPQLDKSSGLSWSCTCLKPVPSSPDLDTLCFYFLGAHSLLTCISGFLQVSFQSQTLSRRSHPAGGLAGLRDLSSLADHTRAAPRTYVTRRFPLASCRSPTEAATQEIQFCFLTTQQRGPDSLHPF